MKRKMLAFAALPLIAFVLSGCAHPQPYYPPPPPPAQIAQQGFHDGVQAARHDLANGMPENLNRHPRFRNPPVPAGQPIVDYREGFRRGYNTTFRNAGAN